MRDNLKSVAGKVLWSLALPALAALFSLRFLVPSRAQASGHGPLGLLADFAAKNPLLVALALFFAFAAALGYWGRRLGYLPDRTRSLDPLGRRTAIEIVGAIVIAAVAALALRAYVVEVYEVVSPSMVPTLLVGDRVLVRKHGYSGGKPPRRGDVVVFHAGPQSPTGPNPWSSVSLASRETGSPFARGARSSTGGWSRAATAARS